MPQSPFIDIVQGRPVIETGALRHQITLQKLAPVVPQVVDAGGVKMDWQPFLTTRAAINLYRGKELLGGGQTSAEAYMIIAMWWQPGIDPDQQVKGPTGTYKVMAIENVLEMNLVLELICIAIGANQ